MGVTMMARFEAQSSSNVRASCISYCAARYRSGWAGDDSSGNGTDGSILEPFLRAANCRRNGDPGHYQPKGEQCFHDHRPYLVPNPE
jgi:hypothetical protein